MATNSELFILVDSVFAIINNLRKQHKRANLDKVYSKLIKTVDSENTSKEHIYDRINELIFQGKTMNNPNRNNDSYLVNESITGFSIDQLQCSNLPARDLSFVPRNTKEPSSIDLMNTPRYLIRDSQFTSKRYYWQGICQTYHSDINIH